MLYLRCIVLSKSGLGLILLRQVNCEAIVEARSGACGTDCWNYSASRLRAEQGCWMHKNEGRGRQTATVYGRAGAIFCFRVAKARVATEGNGTAGGAEWSRAYGVVDFRNLGIWVCFSLLDCGGMEPRRPCSVVKEPLLRGSWKWLKDLFRSLSKCG